MGMTLEGVSEVSGEVGVSVEGEGKEGVTDAFIDGLNKALTKREILKVHILETAMLDTRDTCNYVAERLGAEPVQAIGNKFIIYRKSDEEKYRKIELPRK